MYLLKIYDVIFLGYAYIILLYHMLDFWIGGLSDMVSDFVQNMY